jgi:hypothetical protein
MVQEAFSYHSVLTYMFLVLLAINLYIPWGFRDNLAKEIKVTRISFFLFSAMISMVAFTGVTLFLIAKDSWNIMITLMMVAFVLLSALEVARSKRLTRLWRVGDNAALTSWRYVGAQILITLSMIAISLYRGTDAVSLP